MPSSAGVNPSLTIAAIALRAAHRPRRQLLPSHGDRSPCRTRSLSSPSSVAEASPAPTAARCARFRGEVRCHYASRDPARAAAFAATARQVAAGAFGSYAEAIADPRIDAVLVATPPDSHLALTLEALAGGKHVIVEKPAFLRAADCARARAAEAQSGRRVLVAENYCLQAARAASCARSSPRATSARCASCTSTRVKHQRTSGWRADPACAGGGALFEGGVHWIDLLANLGLHVETVHGFRPGDCQGGERSMLLVAEYAEGAVGTLAPLVGDPVAPARPPALADLRHPRLGAVRVERPLRAPSPARRPRLRAAGAPRHRRLPRDVPRLPGLRSGRPRAAA